MPSFQDAVKAFNEIAERDEVCYSAIIVGLAQNSQPTRALSLFADMVSSNVGSTMYSVSGTLRAAADLAALEQCRIIHAHAFVAGHTEVVVGTALVDGICATREYEFSENCFLAILTACRNAGLVVEAEKWPICMISDYEVEPGLEHYTCVVGALARAGRLRDAE
ncbi:hypothetical protein IFM89_038615 [Coptis chinensis]|uniref:Pentatricopeptide repeat-containing protein n=1 Tax=Coptis chinensis TaxID=261450 RepID=A0A835M0U3_9MAGN|nr:hypothetical protein IFM89_038615 [Coptis chinensis]